MIISHNRYEDLLKNVKDPVEYARIVYFLKHYRESIEKICTSDSGSLDYAVIQANECSFSGLKTGHIFSNHDDIPIELLKEFKNSEELHFKCVPEPLYKKAKCAWNISEGTCFGLWYLPPHINVRELNTPYKVEPLREPDIETVNKNWEFARGRISSFIKEQIIKGNTFAIYIDDRLASYAVFRENGSMGMLRTIPEFRGLGLAKVITYAMIKEARNKKWLPHCYIANDNISSQNVTKSCGFIYYKNQYWFKKPREC